MDTPRTSQVRPKTADRSSPQNALPGRSFWTTLLTGATLVLVLGACSSTLPSEAVPTDTAPANTDAIDHLELLQDTPVIGQPHRVTVKAFDARGNALAIDPADLIWTVEDPQVMRLDAPGTLTPLKLGTTTLTVRTRDGHAVSEYPQAVTPAHLSTLTEAEGEPLTAQAAPGLSYSVLNSNWTSYVGQSVNRFGQFCGGSAEDCGQCVALAKAFGNNTPYNVSTQSWYSGGQVLTRGYNPRLNLALAGGDAIATMEWYNGRLRYSLADYSGPGHVALFARFDAGASDAAVSVRDQNYVQPLKIGYHVMSVPKVNGTPFCSATRTTDTGNICNYDKVQVQ